MNRRAYLTAAAALAGGLAGCGAVRSGAGTLDVAVFNHAAAEHTVYLSLLREPPADTLTDATVADERLDIEPQGESHWHDVATVARYLVRYDVYDGDGRRRDQGHLHYVPRDEGADESLAFDISAEGTLSRRRLG